METKDILKKLREDNGMSIKDVAKGTGMPYTMCREYESGDRNLGISAAIKYADFYKCSIDYLLGRPDAPEPECSKYYHVKRLGLTYSETAMLLLYLDLDAEKREKFLAGVMRQAAESIAEQNEQAPDDAGNPTTESADKDQEPTETTDKQASASAV